MLESSSDVADEASTIETSRKIGNVIQHLVTKENVLTISQQSVNKNERFLSLNMGVDLANMHLGD